MKPAFSVIGFTTLSGLGYGMLFVLGLTTLTGLVPTERWLGVVGLVLALGSITVGLLSSTLHLGHPERAWRAISQWRSSWLSREGLAALVTYLPALLFAIGWVIFESSGGFYGLMALAAALGALATVYCTGMIYASLPPIKAWHQPLTTPVYLAFALMTGLLAVHLLLTLFGAPNLLVGMLTLLSIAGAFLLKILYWRNLPKDEQGGPTMESATGLGRSGLVRMLDPPHTQTNYLLEELGFQIGRKHARVLRMLTYLFGLFLPLILTLIALTLDGWLQVVLAFFAFASGMLGVLLERWLFFAEASHTAMLYYGGQARQGEQKAMTASEKPDPSPPITPKRRRAAPKRRRENIKIGDDGQTVGQPAGAGS